MIIWLTSLKYLFTKLKLNAFRLKRLNRPHLSHPLRLALKKPRKCSLRQTQQLLKTLSRPQKKRLELAYLSRSFFIGDHVFLIFLQLIL